MTESREMKRGTHVVLCLNSGSSSLKFALYRLGDGEEVRLAQGAVERIGLPDGHVWLRDKDEQLLGELHRDFPNHIAAAGGITEVARGANLTLPDGAGHRVVHGGPQHAAPALVDEALISELRKLIAFAPLLLWSMRR
jgi:acetate kinase